MTETVDDRVLKLAKIGYWDGSYFVEDEKKGICYYDLKVDLERESVRELLEVILRYTVFHRKLEDCGCTHCMSGIRIKKAIEELKTKRMKLRIVRY